MIHPKGNIILTKVFQSYICTVNTQTILILFKFKILKLLLKAIYYQNNLSKNQKNEEKPKRRWFR